MKGPRLNCIPFFGCNVPEGGDVGGLELSAARDAGHEQGRVGKAHPAPLQGGAGILKIGKALGNGSVLMEQPRPFDVGVAEAAFAYR